MNACTVRALTGKGLKMDDLNTQQAMPTQTFYDIWKGEQWIGMAIGDTPSAARQYVMDAFPNVPDQTRDLVLMPFYGLTTSQNTFRNLGTLHPERVKGSDVSVDPLVHGTKKYDVWHNRYWVGAVEATSPAQARNAADTQWSSKGCDEILLTPHYGKGSEYATFEALRGCRAKRPDSAHALAS